MKYVSRCGLWVLLVAVYPACRFTVEPLLGADAGIAGDLTMVVDLAGDRPLDDQALTDLTLLPDLVPVPDLVPPDLTQFPDLRVPVWTTAATGSPNLLIGVWGSGPNDVYIVGDQGTLLRSTNGGAVFSTIGHPSPSALLFGVWGANANDVYVVGVNATILRTTNSGGAWTPRNAGFAGSPQLLAVWGVGSEVFVTGQTGAFAHTTNSGANFTTGTFGTDQTWGVWGSSTANVFAAQGNTGLWNSTNGAATWSQVVTADLRAVWGSGANDIFAVGNAVIAHFNGTIWVKDLTHFDNFQGVWGSGPNDVYVVTQAGLILRSTDGGLTWPQVHNAGIELRAIWGSSATDIYAVGGAGNVAHYH